METILDWRKLLGEMSILIKHLPHFWRRLSQNIRDYEYFEEFFFLFDLNGNMGTKDLTFNLTNCLIDL